MLVQIVFRFAASQPTDTQSSFWSSFNAQKNKIDSVDEASAEVQPAELERTFKNEFPEKLQNKLNDQIRREWGLRSKPRWWYQRDDSSPKINVEVLNVRYGSLIGDFDISGLGDEGREALLSLLRIYVAPAFQEAMGAAVPIDADITVPNTDGLVMSGKKATSNLFVMAANGLLVLPVIFALLVCYHWLSAIEKEFDNRHADNEKFRAERSKLVELLVDQNAKLSTTILDHAKGSIVNAQVVQDLLVKLVKEKAETSAGDRHYCKPDRGKEANSTPSNTNFNSCKIASNVPKLNTAIRYRAHARSRRSKN